LRTAVPHRQGLTFARGYRETKVACSGWSLTRYTGAKSTLVVTIPQRCFGARAGAAYFGVTMFQDGGTGTDVVSRAYVPRS
jgi:hypothetical protein